MSECIFVVDDDPSVRALCHVYLRGLHCDIMAFARGAEALAEFDAHRSRIALVVADIGPGGLRHDAVLSVVFARRPRLRAILLGEPTVLDLPFATADRVAFEPKPIVAERLVAQVRALLAIQAPAQPERRGAPRRRVRATTPVPATLARQRTAFEDARLLREQAESYRQLAQQARDVDTCRLWLQTARKADEMADLACLVAEERME